MSTDDWREGLARILTPGGPRVALVGIGHELHGDDAAGVEIARTLIPLLRPVERVLVIDAGPAPENVSGALRRFAPGVVLLIDAADMGETPGTVRLLDWQDITGISASTHTLPLHMLARYLIGELGCEVALLGIQPADLSMDAPLSAPVRQAVEEIADRIQLALGECL